MAIEVVTLGGLSLRCTCSSDLKLQYSDLKSIEYCTDSGDYRSSASYSSVTGFRCPVCNKLWAYNRNSTFWAPKEE